MESRERRVSLKNLLLLLWLLLWMCRERERGGSEGGERRVTFKKLLLLWKCIERERRGSGTEWRVTFKKLLSWKWREREGGAAQSGERRNKINVLTNFLIFNFYYLSPLNEYDKFFIIWNDALFNGLWLFLLSLLLRVTMISETMNYFNWNN